MWLTRVLHLFCESDRASSTSFLTNASTMEAPSTTSQGTTESDALTNSKTENDVPRKTAKNESAKIAVEDSCHTLSDVRHFFTSGLGSLLKTCINREKQFITLPNESLGMDHLALSFRHETNSGIWFISALIDRMIVGYRRRNWRNCGDQKGFTR